MRYFFHLADDDARAPEGRDLPDDEAAKAAAVCYAGELLRDDPHALWRQGQRRVEVTDEHGALRWLVISMAIDASDAEADAEPRGVTAFGGA